MENNILIGFNNELEKLAIGEKMFRRISVNARREFRNKIGRDIQNKIKKGIKEAIDDSINFELPKLLGKIGLAGLVGGASFKLGSTATEAMLNKLKRKEK